MVMMIALGLGAEAQHRYLGFDRNDYPGDAAMQSLHSTFAFTGYWLNNPPGQTSNSWRGHRVAIQSMGYGFLLLFDGREYAALKASGDAARVGTTDGQNAVRAAQAEGFSKSAIIFLDQEQGGRMLAGQRAYIHAWADAVVRGGYRAGVYCSGIPFRESAKVSVVTANDIREHEEGRALQFFVSNDQCGPSRGCVFDKSISPSDSGVRFADVWQFAQSPRRPQMTAACRNTYAADGNCYPPGSAAASGLHVDLDAANSPDPSRARTR